MFSLRTEGSEHHIKLPSLRVLHQEEESPRPLAFKASGAYFQKTQRTVGNRDFMLKDTQKISHTLGPKAEAII